MTSQYLLQFLALICSYCCQATHGWIPPEPNPREWKHADLLARSVVISGIAFFSPIHDYRLPPPAVAIESPLSMDEQQLRQSLRPPTADRPQIMLPTSGSNSLPVEKQPIVEGLLSLSNPQIRPIPTDTIVITFRTFDKPDTVLGGARIPATRATFPLAFRLFPSNLLKEKMEVWETAKRGDLLVQAVVCPEDLPRCEASSDRMQAQGVAKLIRNLPGQLEGQTVRGPVALPLQ